MKKYIMFFMLSIVMLFGTVSHAEGWDGYRMPMQAGYKYSIEGVMANNDGTTQRWGVQWQEDDVTVAIVDWSAMPGYGYKVLKFSKPVHMIYPNTYDSLGFPKTWQVDYKDEEVVWKPSDRTIVIGYSDAIVYEGGNPVFTPVPHEPPNPYTAIEQFQFDGMKLLQPQSNQEIKTSLTQYKLNASIPANISFPPNSQGMAELRDKLADHIRNSIRAEVDGIHTEINNLYITMPKTPIQGRYYFTITFSIKHTTGQHTTKVGADFITGLGWTSSSNTYAWYSDEVTFTYKEPIDINGDGIEDNSGDILPSDTTVPQRANYPDGIIGDTQYFFDLMGYYISAPFRALAQLFTSLTNLLGNVLNSSQNAISIVTKFFSWLPSEIQAFVTLSFIASLTFTLWRVIRGN